MTDYSSKLISSDLDAFKNNGAVLTASFTVSGSPTKGQRLNFTTGAIVVPDPDYYQILYDNSQRHSGKFRSLSLENGRTYIYETTSPSYLGLEMTTVMTATTIEIKGSVFNPYGSTVALQSTVINFRYIPYEATI